MFITTQNKVMDLIIKMINRERLRSVTCETCGCLVDSSIAITGESCIRQRPRYVVWHYTASRYNMSPVNPKHTMEEYIHIPYYCKVHAPKEKKVK